MSCCSSKSSAAAASAPSCGAVGENVYSARQPSRVTCHGSPAASMPACTPSVQRTACAVIVSNAAGVSTSVRVARTAAMDRALPASVPPTPPTSMSSSSIERCTRAVSSAVMPNAAAGTPPPMVLPTTTASGRRSHARVQPPGPAHSVCVSSTMRSVPVRSQTSRTAARYPSSGSTMPMLVIAGSSSRHATSPPASAASRASTSLKGTTAVVSCSGTGGPMLPRRATTWPSASRVAKDSSTLPW